MVLDGVEQVLRSAHGAQCVAEAGMRRPWVDEVRRAELSNTTQSLHGWAVQQEGLKLVDVNVPVVRVGDGLTREQQILRQAPKAHAQLILSQAPFRHRSHPV